MSDKPIERLNYFNGQRLEADDLRLEQEYHMRIQRWLMKSLFTPGVADGFDVSKSSRREEGRLMPGLALDDLGRAIILVKPVELPPQGRYLCIRYAERKERVHEGECKVKVNGRGRRTAGALGGAGAHHERAGHSSGARDPPLADTRELIIAELRLKADCTVDKVEIGLRKQAVSTPLARVRPVSLEGEKDIDCRNPKVIRFHVAHARAAAVTLHLRASAFSTLHYTEMPRHNHSSSDEEIAIGSATVDYSLTTKAASGIDGHTHKVTQMKTGATDGSADGSHDHVVIADVQLITEGGDPRTGPEIGLALQYGDAGSEDAGHYQGIFPRDLTGKKRGKAGNVPNANLGGVNMHISEGAHHHNLFGNTDSVVETGPGAHTHNLQFQIAHTPVGAAGIQEARSGVHQLAFFTGLAIKVRHGSGNEVNCTDKILAQLKQTNPSVWSPSGISIASLDGGPGQPLKENGTGPIRLDLIDGLTFDPDDVPYEIELSVAGKGNGGCIHYNLYIE